MLYSSSYINLRQLYIKSESIIDTSIHVRGWIRSSRKQKDILFISIYDGSHPIPLQIIIDNNNSILRDQIESKAYIGSCVYASGKVVKSPAKGQLIELIADKFEIIGEIIEPSTYLPGVKNVPMEHPRHIQHLRPRFRSYGAIYRIRSSLMKIIHDFFHERGIHHLDPNIITTSDCEGGGEVFTITNLLKSGNISDIPIIKDTTTIDFKDDFFEKQAYLTVSSQLQLEALCAGMGAVYTVNPSFRAEASKTKRHLCCFTHLEWELPFINLKDLMDFSEDLVITCFSKILDNCIDDLNELNSFLAKGVINKLKSFISKPFTRITYSDAISLIEQHSTNILCKFKDDLKELPKWGDDLGSYCERYISEEIYKMPVFVYNYPRSLKSFYMKQNNESNENIKTVQGCDLLIPYCGELIGSSIREEKYDILLSEMIRRNMNPQSLHWYLDLRKNGSTPTGGAGLGFDRLVTICTSGYEQGNIRDVVPFPVAYKECEY